MIQRIQTVYLAIALILLGLMAWLPFAEIAAGGEVYTFSIKGIVNEATGEQLYKGLPLMAILGVSVGLQIASIFGYKKRVSQMRIITYNIFLMIGIVGVAYYFKYASFKEMADVVNSFKVTLVFPILAAILNYLAIRAIAKDEALIRSIDRLR